jgi:hypothetical protein
MYPKQYRILSLVVPCDSNPEVSLTFGGKRFAVPGFNIGQVEDGSSECVGGIMAVSGLNCEPNAILLLSAVY